MAAVKIYYFVRDQFFSYCSGKSKVSVCEGEGTSLLLDLRGGVVHFFFSGGFVGKKS